MPKYLISRVKTVATTYVVEADTENEALKELEDACNDGVESSYDIHGMDVVEEYYQSEGEVDSPKVYRVVLATFESGETNPEVMDLVNVDDESDRIMCAPDEFEVGEIVRDGEFTLEEANYVDEQCYGTGLFAFKN